MHCFTSKNSHSFEKDQQTKLAELEYTFIFHLEFNMKKLRFVFILSHLALMICAIKIVESEYKILTGFNLVDVTPYQTDPKIKVKDCDYQSNNR